MPLDFPNTPATNDTYTSGGVTWRFDGTRWKGQHSVILSGTAPDVLTPDQSGSAGSSADAARADHAHEILTGAASSITGSNAEGSSSSVARADHDHALGTGVVSTASIATGAVTYGKLAPQTIDTKSDSYTLVTGDAGKVIAMNKATAQTVTVGASLDLAVGERIDIIQTGAGQVTVSASSTTLNGTPGLKLRAQYSAASLLCTGTDTYILVGDLAA